MPDGTVRESVGGSPFNVACGLGALEVPALLVTQLGADPYGDQVRAHLAAHDVDLVESAADRTSSATVRFEDGEPAYELDVEWTLPHHQLPECDALHVGSLGALLDPGRASVLDLVDQATDGDVFVSYDPNLRDPLPGRPDQVWRDVEKLADRAALVKLSEQDIALIHPGADPEDIARTLLSGERTELVVVTHGGAGATGYTRDLIVPVPAPEVTVVDTVGAGDAFMAGLLARLYEDDAFGPHGSGLPEDQSGLEDLLGAAMAVAALACARAGAWPG